MAGVVDFQDEEQVKSFLENMEVECNYQCYREKDPDGERAGAAWGTLGGSMEEWWGPDGSRERPLRKSGGGHVPGTRWNGGCGTLTTLCVWRRAGWDPRGLVSLTQEMPHDTEPGGRAGKKCLGKWSRGTGDTSVDR